MKKKLLFLICFSYFFASAQDPCINMNYCLLFEDTICLSSLQIDTVLYPGNIWQIGKPHKPMSDSINTNYYQKSIVTDTLHAYPTNNLSVFTIRNIVSMGDYFGLKIFHGMYNVQTDSLKDFGKIEYSPDNGNSWINIIDDTTYSNNFSWDTKPVLTGNSNGWKNFSIMLADLGSVFNIQIGDTVLFRFSFQSDSIPENLGGLMFDNICFYDFVEGITEIRFKNIKSKMYPNPSNNIFTIEFDNPLADTYELNVYDRNSKLVYTQNHITENNIVFNAQDFFNGTYFYKLTNIKDRKRCWGKFTILK